MIGVWIRSSLSSIEQLAKPESPERASSFRDGCSPFLLWM